MADVLLPIEKHPCYQFDGVTGVGGIGSGIVFLLEGEETLRRDESRPAKLLPSHDYCKLHIVLHYISVLLPTGQGGTFGVYPIGKVGRDSEGQRLVAKMQEAGMDTSAVTVHPTLPTMFSVCLQYEDGSGGNVTTSVSACSELAPPEVDNQLDRVIGPRSLVVALPEVPLETRVHLLRQGRSRGAQTVASVASSEAACFIQQGGIEVTDLLALNMDEAAAFAKLHPDTDRETILQALLPNLLARNPSLMLIVTDGSRGSYGCTSEGVLKHVPPMPANVVQTGGAGDALLSGTLVGLICGLPLVKSHSDEFFGQTPLDSALELGTVIASLSLSSPDTIHESLDVGLVRDAVRGFQLDAGWTAMCSMQVRGGDYS